MNLYFPNVNNTKSTKQTKPEFENGQIFVMTIAVSLSIHPEIKGILEFSSQKKNGICLFTMKYPSRN